MTSQLSNINSLQLNDKGIWVDPDDQTEFGYSDGADEENYLIDVLKSASDLTLDSAELRQASRDWVSDYHLSAIRANLLRTINFPRQAAVLEVGSGCGALTHYLGESGFRVDAVEGSATRAEITALRCRDLDNVTVIKHNFNTLDLPVGHYDAVLFIGVLEYAKRFIGIPGVTSEQAVIHLVKKAAASLCANAVIIAAIENRTGLKYVKGAFEDHLARPNVGIDNYQGFEFTGIKTYDCEQWQQIISQASLVHRLFFPFGDYKFPNLVINEDVEQQDAAFLSQHINSHDPISSWVFPHPESRQWSEVLASGKLSRCANSFGLVIAQNRESLVSAFKNKWALFDKVELKKECRIDLTDAVDIVIKNKEMRQIVNKLPDYYGRLSEQWLSRIDRDPAPDTLIQLASELNTMIEQSWPQNRLVDADQAYSDGSGSPLKYARCWLTKADVTARQQLFHWLLEFFMTHQKRLSGYRSYHFQTLADLILSCMNPANAESVILPDLAEFENRFRKQTQVAAVAVEDELAFMISSLNKYRFRHVNAQVFWSNCVDIFSARDSRALRIKQTLMPQLLTFRQMDSGHRYLRFDPCDHEYGQHHHVRIESIRMTSDDGSQLLSLQGNTLENTLSVGHDIELVNQSKLIYKVSGIDAQLKFSLPEDLSKITHRYNLEIKLQWLGS